MALLQIRDTGKKTKTGAVVYPTAFTDYKTLPSGVVRADIDIIKTSHDGYDLDSAGNLAFIPNETTSLKATRFNITINFPYSSPDEIFSFNEFINLRRTRGLKQIKGGIGTIDALSDGLSTNDIYCIITAIKTQEVIASKGDKVIAVSLALEEV